MTKRKNLIIFISSVILFAVVLSLTITAFVLSAETSDFSMPGNQTNAVAVRIFDDEVYVSTDSDVIACYKNDSALWETSVTDRVSDFKITENKVVVSYKSSRNVDVFSKADGSLLKSIEIPYAVTEIACDDDNIYVLAFKGALKGSNVYYYENYEQKNEKRISFSTVITSVALDKKNAVLYGVGADYNLYKMTPASSLSYENFAHVDYEPFSIGMADGKLVVADKEGFISVFSDDRLERKISAGMTLCAFGYNENVGDVVAANISGKAAIVNVNDYGVKKLSVPTEVQFISVSDSGTMALIEYRNFNSAFIDTGKADVLIFLSWSRWVALALAVFSALYLVTGILLFAISDRLKYLATRAKYNLVKQWKSYAFILPTFVLLGVFMYIPAVWGLCLSFFDYVPGVYSRFVGFSNFAAVLRDEWFTNGIVNMLILLVTDIIKALVPALIIAELILALNSKKMQYWVRVLIYIPGILPGVAVLLIWTNGIYGDTGLLNSFADLFNLSHVDWLSNKNTALLSLIMIGLPWVGQYILFYGALMSVPNSYREAAALDGCNWFKRVFYVDIPMIRPQLKYVFIITFINSIQDFGRIYMTTGQKKETNIPALQMYMTLNSGNGYGKAAAMGMLIFIVIFAATLFNFRSNKKSAEII